MDKFYSEGYNLRDYLDENPSGYKSLETISPTGTTPETRYIMGGTHYHVQNSSWKNILVSVLQQLYKLDADILDNMADSCKNISRNSEEFYSLEEIDSGLYVNTKQSADSIKNMLLDILAEYGLSGDLKIKLKND